MLPENQQVRNENNNSSLILRDKKNSKHAVGSKSIANIAYKSIQKKIRKAINPITRSKSTLNECFESVGVQQIETEKLIESDISEINDVKNIILSRVPIKIDSSVNQVQSNKIKFLLNCKELLKNEYKKKASTSNYKLNNMSYEGPLMREILRKQLKNSEFSEQTTIPRSKSILRFGDATFKIK